MNGSTPALMRRVLRCEAEMDTMTESAPVVLDCLLVEDDPLIRLCLETMLRSGGHTVTSAADGALAVIILAAHTFDVVISDIRMPNLDGWGVFAHVRLSSPDTAVILMTAYATLPDATRALQLGAAEYMPKPVHADE